MAKSLKPKSSPQGKKSSPKKYGVKDSFGFLKDKPDDEKTLSRKTFFILGLLIVLLAFFIRTYHLSSIPAGVYPDEAVNGTDALAANASHHWKLFYTNNNGREGLFMNLIALGFTLFGVSVVTLKMWSVLAGTLTVLGMILLGEELFRSRRAGLIAGFLTATTFWAINFSRISFRASLLPFVLVFTIFFLIRGIQKKKIIDYAIAGMFFGLGTYTYIAFRIAPLILIVLLAAFIISRKRFLATHWKEIAAFSFAMILVALPMLVNFAIHPELFTSRTGEVSVFNPAVNGGHLLLTIGASFGKTLAEFNFYGDQNWRQNLPTQPELPIIIGMFFLAGLFYSIYEFFYLLYRRIKSGERSERLILVSLLLSWFFVMLLPAAMTYEGIPHALRSIGSMPAALLIAVFSIEAVFKWAGRYRKAKFKKAVYALLTVAIIGSGLLSTKMYFVDWGQSKKSHQAFNQNFMNMAKYINNLPVGLSKYVVTNGGGKETEDGFPVSAQVIKLFTYGKTANIFYVKPDFDPGAIKKPSQIILMGYDDDLMAKIETAFPGANFEKIDPQPGFGTDFATIRIK